MRDGRRHYDSVLLFAPTIHQLWLSDAILDIPINFNKFQCVNREVFRTSNAGDLNTHKRPSQGCKSHVNPLAHMPFQQAVAEMTMSLHVWRHHFSMFCLCHIKRVYRCFFRTYKQTNFLISDNLLGSATNIEPENSTDHSNPKLASN